MNNTRNIGGPPLLEPAGRLSEDYKPLRDAVAHLLVSPGLYCQMLDVNLLVAPLNSLGNGGLNGNALVDVDMIQAAFTQVPAEEEYGLIYNNMNIAESSSRVLVVRLGVRRDRSNVNSPRVTAFGCFNSLQGGLEARRAAKSLIMGGLTINIGTLEYPFAVAMDKISSLLPASTQKDLVTFLFDQKIEGLSPCYEKKIFRIRDNDPNMNHLFMGRRLDVRAWKQLGKWLHSNTNLVNLCIEKGANLKGKSMKGLCAGLQHNKSIREFEIGGNPIKKEEMLSLAPFIMLNPSLHTLSLEGCLKPCAIELLSSALMERTCSIENLNIDGNSLSGGKKSKSKELFDSLNIFGKEEEAEDRKQFNTFIMALSKNTKLQRISLMGNRIGVQACLSIATLLKDPASNLNSLILRHNYIDDTCAGILADALSNNTQLINLDLDRNERMTPKGLMKLLNCVCKIPCTTIHLNVSWVCPRTGVGKSAHLKIKLNEPLHCLGVQLYSDPRWAYSVEDIPKVKIVKEQNKLVWAETPFYYNMRDGDSLRIIIQADSTGRWAPPPNLLDLKGGLCVSQGSLQDTATGSNHTLICLGYETPLRRFFVHGPLLRECLYVNKRQDKSSATRVKMFRVHVQYNLNIDQFIDMDSGLIPRVLAWIERALGVNDADRTYFAPPPPDIMKFNTRYQLIRNLPELFEC